MHRRSFVAAVGIVALAGGCTSSGSDPTPGDGNGDTPTPTLQAPEPVVVSSDVETVDSDCASGEDDRASAAVEDGAVRVEGVTTASNPCHRAKIDSASVRDGTVRVSIGTEAVDTVCVECVGAISYVATVDVENATAADAVRIEHAYGGREFTVRFDEGE